MERAIEPGYTTGTEDVVGATVPAPAGRVTWAVLDTLDCPSMVVDTDSEMLYWTRPPEFMDRVSDITPVPMPRDPVAPVELEVHDRDVMLLPRGSNTAMFARSVVPVLRIIQT